MSIQRAYPCDCRVDVSHDPQGVIRYCPTHKAAPELLEALEAAISHASPCGDSCDWEARADRAIAKARGEA
jgi:hypothetical protein